MLLILLPRYLDRFQCGPVSGEGGATTPGILDWTGGGLGYTGVGFTRREVVGWTSLTQVPSLS